MSMNIIMVLLFLIWAYIVWTCGRAQLKYQKFLIGSVGLFIFLMFWLEPIASAPLERVVALVAGIIGEMTGTFESYYQYAMLFISNGADPMSIYVSFECSGIIESFAFVSLLLFFEIYDLYERVVLSVVGVLTIFVSNVIRIVVISWMIYFGGNDIYYFAHSIVGRFVFYALSIALYFCVFTKPHIIRQRVGRFSYSKKTDVNSSL